MAVFSADMTTSEQRAVLTIAMMAAFADGENSEVERAALRSMADSFGPEAGINLWDICQDVLNRHRPLGEVVAELTTPAGVCEADGVVNDRERAFLDSLRAVLGPGVSTASAQPAPAAPATAATGTGGSAVPLTLEPVDTEAIDKMVINYSILNGALELLPHDLATLAIVPLQIRMVYRIGHRYGFTLDRGHVRDFLATAGVGLASQAVEGMARRFLGGLAGQLLGGVGRAVVGAGTGGAFAFAGRLARHLRPPAHRGQIAVWPARRRRAIARPHAQSVRRDRSRAQPAVGVGACASAVAKALAGQEHADLLDWSGLN